MNTRTANPHAPCCSPALYVKKIFIETAQLNQGTWRSLRCASVTRGLQRSRTSPTQPMIKGLQNESTKAFFICGDALILFPPISVYDRTRVMRTVNWFSSIATSFLSILPPQTPRSGSGTWGAVDLYRWTAATSPFSPMVADP